MSELGYSMMFGETKKEFFFKNIKGRGYADTGKGGDYGVLYSNRAERIRLFAGDWEVLPCQE